ncbi:MAG: TIGR01459 family HAD-type hydrolase [Alphaproteobacteria bacterium]|nr:TIGR01459 family HAD-type hydrolase [Alphaproteobacteria bacterium]
MKMIKPIVNISKIIDTFDVVLCGLDGVLYDGETFKREAINALISLKRNGKKIILLSNTPMRLEHLFNLLYENQISPLLFDNIVTMGEVLHYKLQSASPEYQSLGRVYYNLSGDDTAEAFAGLNYQDTENYNQADFLFVAQPTQPIDLAAMSDVLSHCAGMQIPMLCLGAENSTFIDGEISSSAGAVAEQYAILGGKIILLGKPDKIFIDYALENITDIDRKRIIMIGDSLPVDIKAADSANISSLLISKGIHVNYLGEGYIPDVSKAKELSANFNTFPDYVISSLRW